MSYKSDLELITMSKLQEYKKLLSYTYDEAVEHLIQKYGPAQVDYYSEKSYQGFLNGEIKKISKGKHSRTSEGLYCHHIDENKALKLSNEDFIKSQNIPFEYHKKDRLVYCDLIEHSILHILISIETNFDFGFPGYITYLKPNIEDWYIYENKTKPKTPWRLNCYQKAYLEKQEAIDILNAMEQKLDEVRLGSDNAIDDAQAQWLKLEEKRLQEDKIYWASVAETLDEKSPRNIIVESLYHLKYRKPSRNFNLDAEEKFVAYDSEMKQYTKDKIFEELMLYLEGMDDSESEEQ